MSKVEELRAKYPKLTNTTFNKFVEGDKTKTKKYLPYMLKTWVNRNYLIPSSSELVNLVTKFDELLPHIEEKDIYNKKYEDISFLLKVLNDAMLKKEDSLFVREEHVNVLFEDDNYLLLQPKTHKGSIKYGANTKWCTASRDDKSTFDRYCKRGYLTYLISKKNTEGLKHGKIAFYSEKGRDPLFDMVEVFDTQDSRTNIQSVVDSGIWDVHDIFTFISIHRANFSNWKRKEHAKEHIKDTLDIISRLNFDHLSDCLKVVESSENLDYIENVKNKLNEFIKKIPVNL
jgi:hypothetical protein